MSVTFCYYEDENRMTVIESILGFIIRIILLRFDQLID